MYTVAWNRHPYRCGPRSLMLNLRDQEITLPHHQNTYADMLHFIPLWEASSRSLTRVISGCLIQQRFPSYTMTHLLSLLDDTCSNIFCQLPLDPRMTPCPYMNTKIPSLQFLIQRRLPNTPYYHHCHHL
jgi:hypothetical protein